MSYKFDKNKRAVYIQNQKTQGRKMITYKFRAYQSKKIQQEIFNSFEVCREYHNHNLAVIKEGLNSGNFLGWHDTSRQLPKLKEVNPQLKNIYSKSLQEQNKILHKMFKMTRTKRKQGDTKAKYPRFRNQEGQWNHITYNQSGFKIEKNICTLSKIGRIPFKLSRRIKGNVKQVTLKKKREKYFLCVVTDHTRQWKKNNKCIGIDWGVNNFLTCSNGYAFESYYPHKKYEKQKRKLSRKLSRTEKNSNNRIRVRKQLAIIGEKLHNQRMDWIYKIKNILYQMADTFYFEDVRIQDLCKITNWKVSKEKIMLSCVGLLRGTLSMEGESPTKRVFEVDKKNTTQECCKCGYIPKIKKTLEQREHNCSKCGFVCDRDYNSSHVVLNRGMGYTSLDVESKPLHVISPMDVISCKFALGNSKSPS